MARRRVHYPVNIKTKALLVVWRDSTFLAGWQTWSGEQRKKMQGDSICTSIGFLIDETPTTYYLAQTKNRTGDGAIVAIPKNLVAHTRNLPVAFNMEVPV